MRNDSFYPIGQGDQIDWNTNIIQQLPGVARQLDISEQEQASIINDCRFEIFLLTTVGEMAGSTFASLHGFVKTMEQGPQNSPAISLPALPTWPEDAPPIVPPGIAARRSAWVAKAKKSRGYIKETHGRILRLEPVRTPFDPETYVAQLKSVKAVGHEQVLVVVGKGNGHITMLKLQMRLKGQTQFKEVATFTSRNYIDATPLAQPGVPEEREYQLIALRNDQPIGQPSPILSVLVN